MKTLKTRWTQQVLDNPDQVLQEYPRPALVRDSYVNLNGYWDYAITTNNIQPETYDGKILVPFSPESYLSGVQRQLQPNEYLWYRRELPKLPKMSFNTNRWILHFGAVDQIATVIVNGVVLYRNTGGYLPFSVDITDALRWESGNILVVKAQDCSDTSYYSRGKQKLKHGGMYYTAQSGIWQTVWMEEVPENHIADIKIESDIDNKQVGLVVSSKTTVRFSCEVTYKSGYDSQIKKHVIASGLSNTKTIFQLPAMHVWTPEDPFLYGLEIYLEDDHVTSYFAMRKISIEKDICGIPRIYLNNQPYFQKGLLDQGYWSDGLYTAPSDDALIFDITEMKRLGFNMLRKHCKIEPERWYYHCDRLGMLVWQDMLNGGTTYKDWFVTYFATLLSHTPFKPKDHMYRLLSRDTPSSRRMFEKELKQTIHQLHHHPSIVVWTLFNEGWGQFDSKKMTEIAKREDSTRLIDHASGWFDQGVGDFKSIHEYFVHLRFRQGERVTALTEFGGYSWNVPLHSACEHEYGYKKFKDKDSLSKGYEMLIRTEVLPNIKKGLSVTIYTQVSDIEEEVNGIYTYDREVLKIDEEVLMKCNRKLTL